MDFPSLDELFLRRTSKWSRFDPDVLPLFVAESDFNTCPAVMDAIQDAVNRQAFGYPVPTESLGESLAGFYERRYGQSLDPSLVFALPDVVSGLVLALRTYLEPLDSFIVALPCYPPFLELAELSQRSVLYTGYTYNSEAGRWQLDIDHIETLFAAGAKAFVLCHPHNPLGAVHTREELEKLASLAYHYGARIIVDEIHGPLNLDSVHIPAASVSPEALEVCVTLTAASKAFNVPGLKCAQLIVHNEKDRDRYLAVHPLQREGYSTLGLVAADACYTHGDSFLDEQLEQLRTNREIVMESVDKYLPGASIIRPEATYLAWIDVRELGLGNKPAAFFVQEARVALNEGDTFGPKAAGHVRLNFACAPSTLEQAFTRMGEAVARVSG